MENIKTLVNDFIDSIGYESFVIGLIMVEKNCDIEVARVVYEEFIDNDYFRGVLDIGECWDYCIQEEKIKE